jgi:hypothetical protein
MTRAPAVARAALVLLVPLALAALLSGSCSAPLMTRMPLPSGPGVGVVPEAAADQAVQAATVGCRGIQTITAEVGVAGSVGGRRTPSGHVIVALAAPASARIEAPAPFGPVFIFVARDADAQLVLVRDNRVLEHGPPAGVLEALTGVPLDAADLRTMLTGCAVAADAKQARQLADDWMTMPDGTGTIYLRRAKRTNPWQIVTAVRHDSSGAEWHAEYRDFQNHLARSIHLWSSDAARFDLGLSLSQVEINVPLQADAFSVRIPRAATPITLSELKDAGPVDLHGR